MGIEARTIAGFLGTELHGKNILIHHPDSLNHAVPGGLVFSREFDPETENKLNRLNDVLAILPQGDTSRLSCSHIVVARPKHEFGRVVHEFFGKKPTGQIANTAVFGKNVSLGLNVTIGEYSVIGNNVVIGDRTEIRHHTVIAENTVIGSDCLIKSHSVIGEEGFEFAHDAENPPVYIPHLGSVEIGKHVMIGALNTVVQNVYGKTVIKDHVKTDDHVHIAHNVEVGENTLIAACAEISGSVVIGRNVWIGPNASIKNGISIGDRAMVGIGAVVTKDVDSNRSVVGNPARGMKNRFE